MKAASGAIHHPAVGIQNRLHGVAAVFLFAYSLALTLSPLVRLHTSQADFLWVHWLGYFAWLAGFTLLIRFLAKKIPDADPFLLPAIGLLAGWGLLAIFRINPYFGLRQTGWLGVGLIVLWLILRNPDFLDTLRRYKYVWLVLGILLVGITLWIGVYPQGSGPQLWLGFAGFFFQPSELLKLLLVIFLSAYLVDRIHVTFSFNQLAAPAILMFIVAVSILLVQRDLGTSALLMILFSIMLFLAAGNFRQIAFSLLIVVAAGIAGYFLFDVIRLRVDAWINPWLDPSGRSYQIVQSLMAFAAGGISGRGPGLGSPRVVPVSHSDFIFSAIGEESGLVGTVGLVCILILILYRGFRIAFRARTGYYRLLAAGITTLLAYQSILIMGGNLRVLPLTGVTLPFVSYGGSSLLISLVGVGILLKASDTEGEDPASLQYPLPYLLVFGAALTGFLVIILVNGWWSIVRAANLLNRTDNPRLSINETYSPRGNILDRQGQPVNLTRGEPGTYQRAYLYPPLSTVFGFDTSSYGQTGLEASLDGYLRGERGTPASTVWWNHLIYGQPPAGSDIQTTIDMRLQSVADSLFEGRKGALVLMNSSTGEILAMTSHPNVDPNQADTMWPGWMSDPSSPLLNRATQVSYPAGTMLAPFFLAAHAGSLDDIDPPGTAVLSFEGMDYTCGLPASEEVTWGEVVSAGCPAAYSALAHAASNSKNFELLQGFGFLEEPSFILPQAEASFPASLADANALAFGEEQLKLTPLQMALAAAALTNGGEIPAPRLASSFENSTGKVYFPAGAGSSAYQPGIERIPLLLASQDYPGWGSSGESVSGRGNYSWFIGGTTQGWKGTPLALALVIENGSPLVTRAIGEGVLKSATATQ